MLNSCKPDIMEMILFIGVSASGNTAFHLHQFSGTQGA